MEKIERANKRNKKQARLAVKNIKSKIKHDIYECQDKKTKKIIKSNSYKRYTQIYLKFGQQAYIKNVPKSIRKKDVNDLYVQDKFLEIYEKHGEKVFKKLQTEIMAEDIAYETGSRFKGEAFNFIEYGKNTAKKALAIVTSLFVGGNILTIGASEMQSRQSVKKHSQEISDYIDSIDQYAQEIKSMKLSDIEIIMKVMDDMWKNIDGYGEPSKDLPGCLGLDMSEDNGIGVCRNMADDYARKLNAINPEYNARIIAVDSVINASDVKFANIKVKAVETQPIAEETKEIVIDSMGKKIKYTTIGIINGFIEQNAGNHAVVIMDIPTDNVTLIVDPTNPSVGTYKDGKIKMFNSETESGMILERTIFGEELLCGLDVENFPEEFFQSFSSSNLSDEELEKKYGLEAQNQALNRVRLRDKENFLNTIIQYYEDKGINIDEMEKNLKKQNQHIEEEER